MASVSSDSNVSEPQAPVVEGGKKDSEWYQLNGKDNFTEMNLPRNLLKGIFSYGFENPSEVQRIAIDPVLDKRDTIA